MDEIASLRKKLQEAEQKAVEEQRLREQEQRLREQEQRLREQEQRLREQEQRLREQDQHLHEESERLLAIQINELKGENSRMSKKLKRIEEVNQMFGFSNTKVCDVMYTNSKGNCEISSILTWSAPSNNVVKSAWSAVTAANLDDGIGPSPEIRFPVGANTKPIESNRKEDCEYHPKFARVAQIILSCLYRDHLNCPSVLVRSPIAFDGRVPDFTVGDSGLKRHRWLDASLILEFKLPGNINSACGQSFFYLYQQSKAWSRAVEQLEISPHESLPVSMACDWNQIVFSSGSIPDADNNIYLSRTDNCFKYTACMDLFKDETWKSLENPPKGFVALCHALNRPFKGCRLVDVGNTKCVVERTFFESSNVAVYLVHLRGDPVVVKLSRKSDFRSLCSIDHEKANYEQLYLVVSMQPYMVKPLTDIKIVNGFAMMEAIPLLEYQRPNNHDPNEVVLAAPILTNDLMIDFFVHLLLGLSTLHGLGKYHGDIRPDNIVVFEGTARFIDWMSLRELDRCIPLWKDHGNFFWPKANENRLWTDEIGECGYVRGQAWDLYSLSLSFMFLYYGRDEFEMKSFMDSLDREIEPDAVLHPILFVVYSLNKEMKNLDSSPTGFFDNSVYERYCSRLRNLKSQ